MGNLLNFAVYNPAILKDDDFLAGFIARQALAESLLQGLKRLEPDGPAKHRLILGQRGMGKTSLLRRIALGVAQDEELSARFLPLSFREEQYNVHNLRTFWNNCLDALGDCLEKAGRTEQAEAVDADIAKLERSRDPEGEEACRLFKDWCKREGKRPLLLLDNIDIILDGLAKQDWAFRRILQERGGAVVFGATVNPLEATAKIEGAFYDFFQVTVLEKLSFPELTDCLRQLAAQRGEDGKKVQRVLNRDIGRIHTLYDFTGGNPRTLVLLYLLLELDSEEDVMTDLERLLDQVSVLYKARVEDLAPQARVVLDAVALNWNPATVATIRDVTGLETGSIAAQLDRLQKNGVIEKTALSTPTAAGYQLGERLFNIWYLMRHGQRRQRNRLRWLSEFLRGFYAIIGLIEASPAFNSEPPRGMVSDTSLLRSKIKPYNRNGLAEAVMTLSKSLDDTSESFFINYFDDVIETLYLAGQQGYAGKLLAWFDESGLSEHFWPLRAAFEAYLYGEAKLRDVNPEIRTTAKWILTNSFFRKYEINISMGRAS